MVNKKYCFQVKRVFDENATQSDVFQRTTLPILEATISGYNGCIITYGQSKSGKTHTLTGATKNIEGMGRLQSPGIIPRTFHYLFELIKNPKYENVDFTFKLCIIKIYNDKVYDLLSDDCTELKVKGAGTSSGSLLSSRPVLPQR